MKKNTASQKIGAQMVSATDGSAFTSAVTVYVCGDAGTQAVGSVGAGACTHEGNGYHTYAPAQAETNYDLVAFTFIGSGAVPGTVQVFTSYPQTGDAYAETTNGTYGLSAIENLVDGIEATLGTPAGASVSADIAAIEAQTDDIGAAGAGLTAVPWNPAWDAEVESEVDDALGGGTGTALTAIPWNAAWDAEVQSEVADGLTAYGAATATDVTTAAANVSVDEIQATALADLFNTNSGTTYASAVAGSPVKEIADNAGGSALTEAGIADAVWDEVLSGHLTAGTTGNALNAAGSAGDPWSTAIPGAYGAGTAGKILGDNINATISSRASQTSVDTIDNLVDDLESRIGTPSDLGGGATVAANLVVIEGQTDDIGVAGAGLTAIPWNAAWDAEVQSEVADGLAAYDPPTHAEMTAELAAADDATLAAIAALNDLDAAGIRTAVGLAAANLDTQLDAIPTATENADALLDRNMATGTDSGGRTPRNALRFLRNKWTNSGGALTVYKEDDATSAWTAATTTAAGDPVDSIDPA